jgi:hypothetical protein
VLTMVLLELSACINSLYLPCHCAAVYLDFMSLLTCESEKMDLVKGGSGLSACKAKWREPPKRLRHGGKKVEIGQTHIFPELQIGQKA